MLDSHRIKALQVFLQEVVCRVSISEQVNTAAIAGAAVLCPNFPHHTWRFVQVVGQIAGLLCEILTPRTMTRKINLQQSHRIPLPPSIFDSKRSSTPTTVKKDVRSRYGKCELKMSVGCKKSSSRIEERTNGSAATRAVIQAQGPVRLLTSLDYGLSMAYHGFRGLFCSSKTFHIIGSSRSSAAAEWVSSTRRRTPVWGASSR